MGTGVRPSRRPLAFAIALGCNGADPSAGDTAEPTAAEATASTSGPDDSTSAGASAGTSGTDHGETAAEASSGSADSDGGSSDTGGAEVGCTGTHPVATPILSHGLPAFASSGDAPGASNDTNPASTWFPAEMPAWLAYDLSAVPEAARQRVLVAWYAPHADGYILENPGTYVETPIDYTLEINTAAGGTPPVDGWQTVVDVTGNDRSARQHLVDLGGATWVRMVITASVDPAGVAIDLDVHAAPDGACDSWLLMGDSITHISMGYAFSDVPAQVNAIDGERWPQLIEAAIGGTNTTTAIDVIDETMADWPGRFVVLAYGTNDHADSFDMESLVLAVIAAGKVPVVPHIPWSDSAGVQAEGPAINATIDALYVAYPEILPGPDLWAAFEGRTDLIPHEDVHPNGAGIEELRRQWALTIAQ